MMVTFCMIKMLKSPDCQTLKEKCKNHLTILLMAMRGLLFGGPR